MFQRDEKFTEVFRSMTSNLTSASELLEKFLAEPTNIQLRDQIKDHEHRGDLLVKEVILKLDVTFITPFDREDIHELAGIIDDVLDLVHRATAKITMYGIRSVVPGTRELAHILTEQTRDLESAVVNLKNYSEVLRLCEHVSELEKQGDALYSRSICSIFENVKDPIELIKLKEVIETVESALNRSQDVGDVLESIVIKNT
jgi:hypothetical protein